MLPYSRRQIAVLLFVLGAAGAGVAVDHWRRGHPDLVERLERLDHEPPPADLPRAAAPPGPGAAPARGPAPAGPTAAGRAPSGPIDLNAATVEDLRALPGVGPVLAARIVASREGNGRFASVDDLRRVRGLGPRKLERLRDLVTVAE